jgi:hypothetical protein
MRLTEVDSYLQKVENLQYYITNFVIFVSSGIVKMVKSMGIRCTGNADIILETRNAC